MNRETKFNKLVCHKCKILKLDSPVINYNELVGKWSCTVNGAGLVYGDTKEEAYHNMIFFLGGYSARKDIVDCEELHRRFCE